MSARVGANVFFLVCEAPVEKIAGRQCCQSSLPHRPGSGQQLHQACAGPRKWTVTLSHEGKRICRGARGRRRQARDSPSPKKQPHALGCRFIRHRANVIGATLEIKSSTRQRRQGRLRLCGKAKMKKALPKRAARGLRPKKRKTPPRCHKNPAGRRSSHDAGRAWPS